MTLGYPPSGMVLKGQRSTLGLGLTAIRPSNQLLLLRFTVLPMQSGPVSPLAGLREPTSKGRGMGREWSGGGKGLGK